MNGVDDVRRGGNIEREEEEGEACDGNNAQAGEVGKTRSGTKVNTLGEEIRSDCRGIVEGHLLKAEAEDEAHCTDEVLTSGEEVEGEEGKAEHDGVVLEVAMVDEEESGLEKEK